MILRLSYSLSTGIPFYAGLPQPRLDPLYQLARGDVCNSYYLTTSNHVGTHIDAPNHFDPNGRKIAEYQPEELVFTRAAILPVEVPEDRLIRAEHLQGASGVRRDCDLLLIRTGYSRFRTEDPRAYVERSPGFSRAAAECLLAAFPELRAVAVDFISFASPLHEQEGCDAHRVLLGCPGYGSRPVLLIEDALIPDSLPVPRRVLVVPWQFEGLDSAPCTILAEL